MATSTPKSRTTVSFKKNSSKTIKHVLNTPYALNWPTVAQNCSEETIDILIRSLTDVNLAPPTKYHTTAVQTKIQSTSTDIINTEDVIIDKTSYIKTVESTKQELLIVGINAVTRCLEKGKMRGGVVCLSAKPSLMTQHIMILAATRQCPVMALHNVSSKLAPVLGIKSVLALGFKKLDLHEGISDPFSEIVTHLISHAPPIEIPWLSVVNRVPSSDNEEPSEKRLKLDGSTDELNSSCTTYVPLQMKSMVICKKEK